MNTNQILDALANDINTLTTAQKMQGAGHTTLLSMGIVFAVLIILILVIKLMGKVVGDKKEANKVKETSKTNSERKPVRKVEAEDEDEIVAVITAAVCQALGSDSVKIHIKEK